MSMSPLDYEIHKRCPCGFAYTGRECQKCGRQFYGRWAGMTPNVRAYHENRRKNRLKALEVKMEVGKTLTPEEADEYRGLLL